MGAAGVVADHAAEGAPVVGGGVRAEGEPVLGDGGAQCVEDDPGFDDGAAGFRVHAEDAVEVAGGVHDHAGSEGWSPAGGAAAALGDADSGFPADFDGGGDVVGVAGVDDAEGDAAVDGGVSGVERPGEGGEVDVAADGYGEGPGERGVFVGC